MREHVDRLLAQTSIVTLALGIAVGWSLFQVAKGVGDLVQGLLTKRFGGDSIYGTRLDATTWIVGGRVLTLTSLITGIVELATVLLVAGLIAARPGARTQ